MKIQQIRNATIIITYAGTRFLVDPMLGAKGTLPRFPFTDGEHSAEANPICELPLTIEEILANIDAVILTHLHYDHVDETAFNTMPKDIKLFVQNEKDKRTVGKRGFTNISVLGESTSFNGITLTKTPAQHGKFPMTIPAGNVCGVVFKHSDEKTLYLVADTIWYDGVARTIDAHKPEVMILNAGGNKFKLFRSVIMHMPDVLSVHNYAPTATLVATHLEGVNHNTVTRKALREFATENRFIDKLLIPDDGETVEL